MKNETILQALRIVSKLEPTITDIPYTSNRNVTISTDSPSRIPHYVKINDKNTSINLLITIQADGKIAKYAALSHTGPANVKCWARRQ